MTKYRFGDNGIYTGNGTSQSITIGWQPCFVMVVSERSAGPSDNKGYGWKTDTLTGSTTAIWRDANPEYFSNGITITSTGFSVGSLNQVNFNGEAMHWFAFKRGPTCDTGTYTGTGGTQTITTGKQPGLIYIFQTTGDPLAQYMKYEGGDANSANALEGGQARFANVLTFTSTGFQVNNECNQNGETYHWVAAWNTSNTWCQCDHYTNTQGTVTTGDTPQWVLIYDIQESDHGISTVTLTAGDHTHYSNKLAAWMTSGFLMHSTGFDPTHFEKSGDTMGYFALMW
jgi:hypothetical protein